MSLREILEQVTAQVTEAVEGVRKDLRDRIAGLREEEEAGREAIARGAGTAELEAHLVRRRAFREDLEGLLSEVEAFSSTRLNYIPGKTPPELDEIGAEWKDITDRIRGVCSEHRRLESLWSQRPAEA